MADTHPVGLMTVDVEDWFHPATFARHFARGDWEGLEQRVVGSTRKILRLLEWRGMRATFFVLGWVAERQPELVREIQRGGHEVASHGYGHQIVYRLSEEAFREDIRRSSNILQDITGERLLGYRAPNFSITDWAVDVLQEAGFVYDSSYFPTVGHDRYGKLETYRPAQPGLAEIKKGFYEVPLSSMEVAGRMVPWSGGGYFRLLPYRVFRRGVRKILDRRGVFNFYIHPWEIDPEQPRVGALSPVNRFRAYNSIGVTEERLERLVKEFTFTSIRSWLEAKGVKFG